MTRSRDFDKWGLELVDVVNGIKLSIDGPDDTLITAKHATEHRIGLKIKNKSINDQITGTDPLKDNLVLREVRAKKNDDEVAKRTAAIVNKLSDRIHQVLSQHPLNLEREKNGLPPANIVLLRGCGSRLSIPSPHSSR